MSEAMLTREQVLAIQKRRAQFKGTDLFPEIAALCTMALSSIAMRDALKPRPLSEFPESEKRALVFYNRDKTTNRLVSRSLAYRYHDGVWMSEGMDWPPETLAIPLTALPEPNDAEAYQEQGK